MFSSPLNNFEALCINMNRSIVAKVLARLSRNRLWSGKAAAERHRDVLERVATQACQHFCNDG